MIKERSITERLEREISEFLNGFFECSVTRAEHGKASAVFRVCTPGKNYFLKLLNSFSRREFDVYAANLSVEHRHLPALLNRNFGITSDEILLMEDVSFGRSHPSSQALLERAEDILSAVAETGKPVFAGVAQSRLQERYKSRVRRELDAMGSGDMPFPPTLQSLRRAVAAWLERNATRLLGQDRVTFIHGNLNTDNILVGDGDVKLIDFENYDVGRPIEDYVNMAFFFPQKMRQEVFRDERCRAIALMYLDKIIAFYFTCTDARKHKDLFDEFLRDYRTVAYLSVPSLRRYDV